MSKNDQAAPAMNLNAVISKAWTEPNFKKRLLPDPAAALAAAGVVVPTGVTVKVFENTDKLVHLVLPVEGTLPEAELGAVAGGAQHAPIGGGGGLSPYHGSVDL